MAQELHHDDDQVKKTCNPQYISRVPGGWTRAWAAVVGLVALGLTGAGLLVWWALAFHPANKQQWMVPVGLILLGTPLLAWLSMCASGATRYLRAVVRSEPPPLPVAVVSPE